MKFAVVTYGTEGAIVGAGERMRAGDGLADATVAIEEIMAR